MVFFRCNPTDTQLTFGKDTDFIGVLNRLLCCSVEKRSVDIEFFAFSHMALNTKGFGKTCSYGRVAAAGINNKVAVYITFICFNAYNGFTIYNGT